MHTPFKHLPLLGLTVLFATHVRGVNLPKRDLNINSTLPSAWSYVGCYTDSTSVRTLRTDSYADDSMTEVSCINFCNGKGYPYAGVEYGRGV